MTDRTAVRPVTSARVARRRPRALLLLGAITIAIAGCTGSGAAATTATTSSSAVAAASVVAPASGAPGAPGGAPAGAPGGNSGTSGGSTTSSSATGATTISGKTDTTSGQTYAGTAADQSAILVTSSGSLTATKATITKTGDTTSADESSFYGLNAGVLVQGGSSATVSDSSITTRAAGANGAFATGTGTSLTLSDVTISANGGGAHAIMATQGATVACTGVNMNTTGANSGAIATDRGGGTITVTGGTVTTSGQDSPGIYSTGAITVTDATISANGAEAAVIEGGNTIALNDTSLSSSLASKWGVMIYQSMSGDATGTKGTFTMTVGSLAYTGSGGPLFYVTNSTGIIALKGVNVTVASGILVKASAGNWGTSGSNGGTVVLTADGQTLSGDMTADAISSITLTLQNNSSWTGAIDNAKSAKAVSVTFDATSKWTLTADSYVTTISGAAVSGTSITNITGNGHTIYYDATNSASSGLNGGTYALVGGGYLKPA